MPSLCADPDRLRPLSAEADRQRHRCFPGKCRLLDSDRCLRSIRNRTALKLCAEYYTDLVAAENRSEHYPHRSAGALPAPPIPEQSLFRSDSRGEAGHQGDQ